MKKFRFAALLTTLALALVMPFAVAEETINPAQLMEDVAGTYVPLFSVLNKPEYDDVWLSHSAEIVGEENAQMIADMMRASTTAEIYGPEAVEAYAADPESMRFDCYFTEGVSRFVFDGNTVTGLDEAGNEVFSHSYTYVPGAAGGHFRYAYKTDDCGRGRVHLYLPFAGYPCDDLAHRVPLWRRPRSAGPDVRRQVRFLAGGGHARRCG